MRLLGREVGKAGAKGENRREQEWRAKYHLNKKGWRERALNYLQPKQQRVTRQRPTEPKTRPAQTREYLDSPFAAMFNAYQPFKFNLDLFDTIRESIPICDVAIIKLCRLIGDFELTADNDADLEVLNQFKQQIHVNHFERGFSALRSQVTDSVLAKGMGFFEVIPTATMNNIARLKVARANDFRFTKEGDKIVLCEHSPWGIKPVPFENQDYIYYLAFDRRDGHPQGYSLFYSLPFVTQIAVRILKSLENQVWRVGDPSFMFVIEKGGDSTAYGNARKIGTDIQDQIELTMQDRKQGKVRDAFGVLPGDATLKVQTLGNDKNVFDVEIPMRTVLEQIVAKTNLPPFMLGLSWSTTERLSTHQNDMIISMIESYREDWNPLIDKLFNTYIALIGRAGMKWGFKWLPVNLMDEVELANARYLNAQSAEKEILNMTTLVSYGWLEADEAINVLIENGVISKQILARLGKQEVLQRLNQVTKERKAAKILKRILMEVRSSGNGDHRDLEQYRRRLIN